MSAARSATERAVAPTPSATITAPPSTPVAVALRYELKCVVGEAEVGALRAALALHPAGFRTAHPPRQVHNIYFDTPDLSAFQENLSGASARTKVRLRWYGEARLPESGTLELKRKIDRLGWKDSYPATGLDGTTVPDWGRWVRRLRRSLDPRGRVALDAHPQPVLINRYRREYFVSADGRIRATLDGVQGVWDQRLSRRPNLRCRANTPRVLVLEVKGDREWHARVAEVVATLPVRVSRYSKYVVALSALLG